MNCLFVASSGSSGSSPGAIAAGVIIGIAVVAIVCVVLILIVYKQRRKRKYSINDHQKDHSLPSCKFVLVYCNQLHMLQFSYASLH